MKFRGRVLWGRGACSGTELTSQSAYHFGGLVGRLYNSAITACYYVAYGTDTFSNVGGSSDNDTWEEVKAVLQEKTTGYTWGGSANNPTLTKK